MSVNPGFGGQKFIERTYEKTTVLRSMLSAAGSNAHIEIDGGVGTWELEGTGRSRGRCVGGRFFNLLMLPTLTRRSVK
jgi:ribulose-phosphate 3-epimerase